MDVTNAQEFYEEMLHDQAMEEYRDYQQDVKFSTDYEAFIDYMSDDLSEIAKGLKDIMDTFQSYGWEFDIDLIKEYM